MDLIDAAAASPKGRQTPSSSNPQPITTLHSSSNSDIVTARMSMLAARLRSTSTRRVISTLNSASRCPTTLPSQSNLKSTPTSFNQISTRNLSSSSLGTSQNASDRVRPISLRVSCFYLPWIVSDSLTHLPLLTELILRKPSLGFSTL